MRFFFPHATTPTPPQRLLVLCTVFIAGTNATMENEYNTDTHQTMQQLWDSFGITEYYYQTNQDHGVFIQDEQIFKVVNEWDEPIPIATAKEDGGMITSTTGGTNSYGTIPEWFDYISSAASGTAATAATALQVTYDSDYGFPTSIITTVVDTSTTTTTTTTTTLFNFVPTTLIRNDVQNHYDMWNSQSYSNYNMVGFRQVFGPLWVPQTIVGVRNTNIIVSIRELESGQDMRDYISALSIAELFDEIFARLDQGIVGAQITFDDELGFPMYTFIDGRQSIADDEFNVHVESITPISNVQADLDIVKNNFESLEVATYNYQIYGQTTSPDDGDTSSSSSGNLADLDPRRIVQVESLQVTQVKYGYSSTLDIDQQPDYYKLTMMEWFTNIQDAIDRNDKRLVVEYDSDFVYPTHIVMSLIASDNDNDVDETMDKADALDVTISNVALYSLYERELQEAEALWNVASISRFQQGQDDGSQILSAESSEVVISYTFMYRISCFCQPSALTPKFVRIDNDRVTMVQDVTTGAELDVTDAQQQLQLPTINELFDHIRQAIDLKYAAITVTYDKQEGLGYPTMIQLTPSFALSDGTITTYIEQVQPPLRPTQINLQNARTKWMERDIIDYNFEYTVYNEQVVPEEDVDNQVEEEINDTTSSTIASTVIVMVQGSNTILKVVDSNGNEISPQDHDAPPTINEMFDMIDDALSVSDTVAVSYDEELGIPLSIQRQPQQQQEANDDQLIDTSISFLMSYTTLQDELDEAMATWSSMTATTEDQQDDDTYYFTTNDNKLVLVQNKEIYSVTPISRGSSSVPTRDVYARTNSNSLRGRYQITDNDRSSDSSSLSSMLDVVPIPSVNTRNTDNIRDASPPSFTIGTRPRTRPSRSPSATAMEAYQVMLRDGVMTVSQMFAAIQDAIDERYSKIEVEYDDTYGYPKSIVLGTYNDVTILSTAITQLEVGLDNRHRHLLASAAAPSPQDELAINKAKWDAQDFNNYQFKYQKSCFCIPEYTTPKLVTVLNGMIHDVTTEKGDPVSQDVADDVPTMEGVFSSIQDAIDWDAARIDIVYDEEYGYPLSIYIDYTEMIADDEYSVTIDEFQPLMIPSDVWKQDLTIARTLWEQHEQDQTTYSFGYMDKTGGTEQEQQQQRVMVVNGVVEKVNGVAVTPNSSDNDDLPPTMMDLFNMIQTVIDNETSDIETLDVTYNEQYGNPTKIYLTVSSGDDNVDIEVTYPLEMSFSVVGPVTSMSPENIQEILQHQNESMENEAIDKQSNDNDTDNQEGESIMNDPAADSGNSAATALLRFGSYRMVAFSTASFLCSILLQMI